MQTSQSRWQDAIHPTLLQRLLRPPGVIRSQLADGIRSRSESWSNRLPLLAQISQRHATTEGLPGQVPIVYAQPLSAESLPDAVANSIEPSAPRSKQTTVVQAKFAPGAASVSASVNASVDQGINQINANPVEPLARSNQSSVPANSPAIETTQIPSPEIQPPQSFTQPFTPFSLPVVSARSSSQDISMLTTIAPESSPLTENRLPVVQAKSANSSLSPSRSTADATLNFSQEHQPQNSASGSQGRDRATASAQKPAAKNIDVKELNQPVSSTSAMNEANSIDPAFAPSLRGDEIRDDQTTVALRSKSLPLVRSAPPQSQVSQDKLLGFSQPTANAANRHRSSSISPAIPASDPFETPIGSGATSTPAAQGLGSHASVVRSIPQQIMQEAEPVPPNQAPQTIVSRAAPASPPAIDVDALADKVERKLMRRMIVERERRGWK